MTNPSPLYEAGLHAAFSQSAATLTAALIQAHPERSWTQARIQHTLGECYLSVQTMARHMKYGSPIPDPDAAG